MFAAIYFGQEFFAGLPFIPVVPPPPPPPPEPIPEYDCRFAIGQVIGIDGRGDSIINAGATKICGDSISRISASQGSRSGLQPIGNKTGPSSGSCP
jgi:hypothetical protein